MKKVYYILFGLLLLSGCSSNSRASESTSVKSSSTDLTSSQVEKDSTTETFSKTLETNEIASAASSTTDNTETSESSSATINTQSTTTINTTTSENVKSDKYYESISAAWQKQKNYVDSITDPKVKQSVQTPFAAANSEANRLEIENPQDSQLINASLEKILNNK